MTGKKAKLPQKNRKETENRLMQAAMKVFAEHGYDGSTTRMIAEEAGVNLSLINRYFGTKHGLLLEMIRVGTRESFSKALPYPPQKTFADECHAFVRWNLESNFENIELFRIIIVQLMVDPTVAAAIRDKDFIGSPTNIIERIEPYFKAKGMKKYAAEAEEFAMMLKRLTASVLIMQNLIGGESKKKCFEELKKLTEALCKSM